MSLKMTREEREAFLMGLHVGVISIEQDGAPPLSVPIWYDYSPSVGVWVITGEQSAKGRALAKAGRFTLVAQDETPGIYKYVSVEGPVIETRPADRDTETRAMAHRYLGQELGDMYMAGQPEEEDNLLVTMQPDRWRTVDYTKLGAQ